MEKINRNGFQSIPQKNDNPKGFSRISLQAKLHELVELWENKLEEK
jgi:hypothetical protein